MCHGAPAVHTYVPWSLCRSYLSMLCSPSQVEFQVVDTSELEGAPSVLVICHDLTDFKVLIRKYGEYGEYSEYGEYGEHGEYGECGEYGEYGECGE